MQSNAPPSSSTLVPSTVLPGSHQEVCPDVLTEQEAAKYLRLDLIDVENPAGALNYYRRKGLLRGTQIGKCVRYRRIELERFLDRITERNPR
ncbi:MAG TPA: helix-turn-helix domain-containing protein [Tepidisphaeraceae bacterium]|jgi:hypothetical protein|nr:helix-turn-helix domain-containing protein [Tepidisphaeraceae bacterium]